MSSLEDQYNSLQSALKEVKKAEEVLATLWNNLVKRFQIEEMYKSVQDAKLSEGGDLSLENLKKLYDIAKTLETACQKAQSIWEAIPNDNQKAIQQHVKAFPENFVEINKQLPKIYDQFATDDFLTFLGKELNARIVDVDIDIRTIDGRANAEELLRLYKDVQTQYQRFASGAKQSNVAVQNTFQEIEKKLSALAKNLDLLQSICTLDDNINMMKTLEGALRIAKEYKKIDKKIKNLVDTANGTQGAQQAPQAQQGARRADLQAWFDSLLSKAQLQIENILNHCQQTFIDRKKHLETQIPQAIQALQGASTSELTPAQHAKSASLEIEWKTLQEEVKSKKATWSKLKNKNNVFHFTNQTILKVDKNFKQLTSSPIKVYAILREATLYLIATSQTTKGAWENIQELNKIATKKAPENTIEAQMSQEATRLKADYKAKLLDCIYRDLGTMMQKLTSNEASAYRFDDRRLANIKQTHSELNNIFNKAQRIYSFEKTVKHEIQDNLKQISGQVLKKVDREKKIELFHVRCLKVIQALNNRIRNCEEQLLEDADVSSKKLQQVLQSIQKDITYFEEQRKKVENNLTFDQKEPKEEQGPKGILEQEIEELLKSVDAASLLKEEITKMLTLVASEIEKVQDNYKKLVKTAERIKKEINKANQQRAGLVQEYEQKLQLTENQDANNGQKSQGITMGIFLDYDIFLFVGLLCVFLAILVYTSRDGSPKRTGK